MNVKSDWMEMHEACFETLTFGELEVGQKFIGLPTPGDNHGHGGFKGAHYMFIKTEMKIEEAMPGIPYAIPHGRAINLKYGTPSDMPHTMSVILIE